MKRNVIVATAALGALVVAGCSSSGSSSSSTASGAATKSCVASIGMEGPLTGPVAVLGQEQLHFAQLAAGQGQPGQQDEDLDRPGRHPAQPGPGDDRHPAVHLELEDRGGGRPGGQPGGRGGRPADGQGGAGVHLRVGDRRGAHHRQVPDVLPDRVQGQRAGTAGRPLHRQQPAPEGADDRRRPGGLLHRPGRRDDADLQGGRDQGRPRVGLAEGHRLLLAGGQGHAQPRRSWSCPGRWRRTRSSSAATSPSSTRRP